MQRNIPFYRGQTEMEIDILRTEDLEGEFISLLPQ